MCMKLVLTHETALDLLRSHRERGGDRIEPARIRTLGDCASTLSQLEKFSLPALVDNSRVIHILVPAASAQCRSKVHVCHVMSTDIPRGAFYEAGDHVYAASPELLFVQQAKELPLVKLIEFGLELCGTYTLRAYDGEGFFNCPACTTRERLAAYLKRAQGQHGTGVAGKALRWVVDGSNSPMESALMLYLCLPVHLGGYGFSMPSLNPKTNLSRRGVLMTGVDVLRCDLHWLDKHVAVEYDSTQEHLSPYTASSDASRRNAMQYEGEWVITATPEMLKDPQKSNALAIQLAKAMRRRMSKDALVLSWERRELRKQLFPWWNL